MLYDVKDDGLRKIIEWMWRVEREWDQTDLKTCLMELYHKLELYELSINQGYSEKSQELPEKKWYRML